MATPQKLIITSSLPAYNGNAILTKAIAMLHAKPLGSNVGLTVKDLIGLSTGNITSYLSGLSTNTYSAIYITCPSNATNATNKIYGDAIAAMDANLLSSVRGLLTNPLNAGTAQANATVTEIVLEATASNVDDFYNGAYIKTAGTTAVAREITDYVGSTHTCTVATTTTAITTTETYIVYTQPNIYVLGDDTSTEKSCRTAWLTLFPTATMPPLVSLMGGYGSGFQPHYMIAQTANSFTISSVTKSAAFTNKQFDSGTWYVAVVSATTGAGQVARIKSNTANTLTIEPFATLPTGTVVFQVCSSAEFALYELYLKFAILVYLSGDTVGTNGVFYQLLDKMGTLALGGTTPQYNATLLKTYADRGRSIFDAVCAGIVS